MKEKIIEILNRYFDLSAYQRGETDKSILNASSDEIEQLVNQEVERRIAERMPSMEETINMATEYVNHKSLHKANKGLIRDAIIIGIGMVRSRLTQKTEGGGNG